jgi:hypothetical protein
MARVYSHPTLPACLDVSRQARDPSSLGFVGMTDRQYCLDEKNKILVYDDKITTAT